MEPSITEAEMEGKASSGKPLKQPGFVFQALGAATGPSPETGSLASAPDLL